MGVQHIEVVLQASGSDALQHLIVMPIFGKIVISLVSAFRF